MNSVLDPVQAQLEAYNARDVERFIRCYADDCIFEDAQGGRLLAGHADMRMRYQALFAASPNLHCDVIKRTHIGNHVIDEENISGRVPDMRRAVVIYRVENGLIQHVRFYRE